MATPVVRPSSPEPGTLHWAPPAPPAGTWQNPAGHIALLHGITSASTSWWSTAPLVAARGWEVTAVDLPGHGQGPKPADGPATMVDMARGTTPRLPPRLTALVGHSLGAVVALAIGLEHPDLATGLVLLEPPSYEGLDMELLATGAQAKGRIAREDPQGTKQLLAAGHPEWDDEEMDRVVAAWAAADGDAIASAVRGSSVHWDLPAMVGALKVPVLVIAAPAPEEGSSFLVGEASALAGPERERLVGLLPHNRFVVVEGGHSLHREQPQEVSRLICAFAEGLRPGAVSGSASGPASTERPTGQATSNL